MFHLKDTDVKCDIDRHTHWTEALLHASQNGLTLNLLVSSSAFQESTLRSDLHMYCVWKKLTDTQPEVWTWQRFGSNIWEANDSVWTSVISSAVASESQMKDELW